MSKTIYVKVAGVEIPYGKKDIKSMFESQIEALRRNLVNPEDSKTIDKWLRSESGE